MEPIVEALLALLLMVLGSTLGVGLRRILPDDHLDTHARDVVRLGAALVATITALVLGLLVNSSYSFFETQRSDVRRVAADLILLDTILDNYGPVALDSRRRLRESTDLFIQQVWNDDISPFNYSPLGTRAHVLFDSIANLPTATPLQRTLHDQAIATTIRIAQSRLDLFERSRAHLPQPMLYVLMLWLTALFASFTLFSPVNPTSIAALILVALCASAALLLILEMERPFSGIMQVPPKALITALPPLP
jgi:hypothetical protein